MGRGLRVTGVRCQRPPLSLPDPSGVSPPLLPASCEEAGPVPVLEGRGSRTCLAIFMPQARATVPNAA